MVVQPSLCTFVVGMQPSQVFSQCAPLILSGILSECQLVKQIKPKVLSGLIWVQSEAFFFGPFRRLILSHVPNGKKFFFPISRRKFPIRGAKKIITIL